MFKSILAGDTKTALAGGDKAITELIAAAHAGMTTEEFERRSQTGVPQRAIPASRGHTDLVSQTMVELLAFEMRGGAPVLVKLPQIDLVDDKAGNRSASRSTSAFQ